MNAMTTLVPCEMVQQSWMDSGDTVKRPNERRYYAIRTKKASQKK